jgi:hypothetical protein
MAVMLGEGEGGRAAERRQVVGSASAEASAAKRWPDPAAAVSSADRPTCSEGRGREMQSPPDREKMCCRDRTPGGGARDCGRDSD